MATKKLGNLIKEARTNAGLSQEKLAALIPGLSASDISKAEHAEKDLTQDQLKAIAKATGVTQKSLLEAAGSKSSAKTTTTGKTGTSAKTSSSTGKTSSSTGKTSSSTGKTSSSTGKTSSSTGKTGSSAKTDEKKTSSASSGTSVKVTATEKKLLDLYRAADSETKKRAMSILKGEVPEGSDLLTSLLGQIIK